MKKILISTFALALLVGTMAMADYYATKADYRAGKLTPAPPLPKGTGSSCSDPITELLPPSPRDVAGDTTGALNTVDALPLTCNGNYTVAPGPDEIWSFNITGAPNSLVFTVTTTDDDYDPSIYAVSTCGDGSSCEAGWGADGCWARSAFGNPCGPISDESVSLVGLSNGMHYFYVDSFYAPANPNGRDVGPYSVNVTGTWPVELIEFSVE